MRNKKSDKIKHCRACGDNLTNNNWKLSCRKNNDYICIDCHTEYHNRWWNSNREREREKDRERHYLKGGKPMNENKSCGIYLGVFIAEHVLSHIFNNVQIMRNGNPGYDFICNNGYRIDVKSSCQYIRDNWSPSYMFSISRNKIADYFLCLAFDNREDLNPLHIWFIPGPDINNYMGVGIAESTITKWDKYKIDKIDDIILCCNSIKQS